MASPLENEANELIRQYRMNRASLRLIERLDCVLDASDDPDSGECLLFRPHSNEILKRFSSVAEIEPRIQQEAARVFGVVSSPEEAADRYTQVLKIIGGG
jgi:hypothetical protein